MDPGQEKLPLANRGAALWGNFVVTVGGGTASAAIIGIQYDHGTVSGGTIISSGEQIVEAGVTFTFARAGQRVMESISRFITQKLKLKVNEAKSAVARPQERKFLGFSFTAGPDIKRTIAPKSLDRFKESGTRRAKGVSIKTTMEELAQYMRGWRGCFGFCQTPEELCSTF
jgi:hypothetical protein